MKYYLTVYFKGVIILDYSEITYEQYKIMYNENKQIPLSKEAKNAYKMAINRTILSKSICDIELYKDNDIEWLISIDNF